jgi:chorismate dehydratase
VKLKIGKIPYLNSVLFYHGLESSPEARDWLEFVPMVPSRLSAAARDNRIDAGPVPVVTFFELLDEYEPLGSFCIATKNKARSILLFSRTPVEKLDHARIGITDETSTSVRLLKVLLSRRYGVTQAEYVSVGDYNDALLLIGDEALRHRDGREGYPCMTDLGEVWHELTGLPFVFAVWVVRKPLSEEQKLRLEKAVSRSLEAGYRRFDEAVTERMNALGMSLAQVREYLEGFHFVIAGEEAGAMAKFKEMDAALRRENGGRVAEAAE